MELNKLKENLGRKSEFSENERITIKESLYEGSPTY
jgi:hypothetical protein